VKISINTPIKIPIVGIRNRLIPKRNKPVVNKRNIFLSN